MSVLLIAGCGIAIVLLSILVFKLHPLMGLLLGSLFLLTATPEQIKLSNQLQDGSSTIVATDESD
ncbi:MAG: hypothetical protein KDB22_29715, partial [Planctomycetales bacterium]|nr:hypothetical protein [Planctomycetales bacterium]